MIFIKAKIDLYIYDEIEKERINAFDWDTAFPEVSKRHGFDAVVGNPPYVKLQNFRRVHADMAMFLRDGRPEIDLKPYASTQTGNFDLYLPFIERRASHAPQRDKVGSVA